MELAADEVVSIALESEGLCLRLVGSLVDQLCNVGSYDSASRYADFLEKSAVISVDQSRMVEKAIYANDQVANSNFGKLPGRLRGILKTKIPGY